VEGNYAYIANYILGGVEVVDVSFPASPFIAAYYKRSGCFGLGVTVEGSHTFLGDGPAGFQIHENLIITGINENDAVADQFLNVYPNPAKDLVNISFTAEKYDFYRILVSDITGRVVYRVFEGNLKAGNHQFQWLNNASDIELPNGMYLLEVKGSTRSFITKIALTR
jgi:hypothetical protein